MIMADIHPILHALPDARRKGRKPDRLRRGKRVPVLVSQEEHAHLVAMARERGCTVSSILRASLHSVPLLPADRKTLDEMATTTAQLSRLLHHANRFEDPEVLIRLITSIQVLYGQILERML